MRTNDTSATLGLLFSELVDGTVPPSGYILNAGDTGLVKSLEKLSPGDASRSTNDGATVAGHVQHLRYGLSLMNRWAAEGGNPFADAKWDEAWKTRTVTEAEWAEIRAGLAEEITQWKNVLSTPREVSGIELGGLIGSVAHLAYHLGAIRQIAVPTRGPREGTFN